MVDKVLKKPVTECILEGNVCIRQDGINQLRKYVKNVASLAGLSESQPNELIKAVMKHLEVLTESAIWESKEMRNAVGAKICDHILDHYYKQKGPANSTSLLSNLDIDGVLEKWQKLSQQLFKKNFHHIPYQMIDFNTQRTELYSLDIADLKQRKIDIWAVVMNTDPSHKGGEHWFCLVGDLQHAGSKEDPIVLEYFNSSGNPYHCYPSLQAWINTVQHRLLRDEKLHMVIKTSIPVEIQKSHTECGVWCLSYIYSRLCDKPYNWFYKSGRTDAEMYEYRKHLFRDSNL